VNKNTISTPTLTLSPQTSHLLNRRRWCHLAKAYCGQANRQNFYVWNSYRLHVARLFQVHVMLYDQLILINSWAISARH